MKARIVVYAAGHEGEEQWVPCQTHEGDRRQTLAFLRQLTRQIEAQPEPFPGEEPLPGLDT